MANLVIKDKGMDFCVTCKPTVSARIIHKVKRCVWYVSTVPEMNEKIIHTTKVEPARVKVYVFITIFIKQTRRSITLALRIFLPRLLWRACCGSTIAIIHCWIFIQRVTCGALKQWPPVRFWLEI